MSVIQWKVKVCAFSLSGERKPQHKTSSLGLPWIGGRKGCHSVIKHGGRKAWNSSKYVLSIVRIVCPDIFVFFWLHLLFRVGGAPDCLSHFHWCRFLGSEIVDSSAELLRGCRGVYQIWPFLCNIFLWIYWKCCVAFHCSVADSSTGDLVINLLCNMFSSLHRTIQYTQSDLTHIMTTWFITHMWLNILKF